MNTRALICLLGLALSARAAPLLSIDFNCRADGGSALTQPGFSSFLITSNISSTSPQTNVTTRMFGGYRVTLWGNGMKSYHDRCRALPTNQAAFTESQLLRDFVFSPDTMENGGLSVRIENLPPASRLQITIWSFDEASPPIRASDWHANGVLVRQAYQFTNSVWPVRNDQYRFSFTALVNPAGQLLIEGRRNAMSTNNFPEPVAAVYLNALQIDPEPLEILSISAVGSELRLIFVVPSEPSDYVVEESSGGAWAWTGGVVYSVAGENRVLARFARPNQTKLYRIRYSY